MRVRFCLFVAALLILVALPVKAQSLETGSGRSGNFVNVVLPVAGDWLSGESTIHLGEHSLAEGAASATLGVRLHYRYWLVEPFGSVPVSTLVESGEDVTSEMFDSAVERLRQQARVGIRLYVGPQWGVGMHSGIGSVVEGGKRDTAVFMFGGW